MAAGVPARKTFGWSFRPRREKLWDTASILLLLLIVTLPYLPHFGTEIQGVRIDAASFFLIPALLLTVSAWALGSWRSGPRVKDFPHLKWCCAYGVVLSLAYISGAYGLGYLTDPVRAAYQVYNYGLKEILLYPLLFVLFCHPRKLRILVLLMIMTAVFNAGISILQGRAGQSASGLFDLYPKNYLASTFLAPSFLALGCATYAVSLTKRTFYGAAFLTFVLALWYAGSRAAVLGFVAGLTCFLATSDRRLKAASTGTLVILAVLIIRPDFGVQSGIRDHFTAVREGTDEGNLQWRTTERWPYFFKKVQEHPWLGVGTDWDPSLDVAMNVPHNGYLSLAVKSGVPALLIFLGFVMSLLRSALAIGRESPDPWARGIGLGVTAAIVAQCIHNVVDAILDRGVVLYTFWTMLAIVAIVCRSVPTKPLNEKNETPRWRGKNNEIARRTVSNMSGRPSWSGRTSWCI